MASLLFTSSIAVAVLRLKASTAGKANAAKMAITRRFNEIFRICFMGGLPFWALVTFLYPVYRFTPGLVK
ncbi:exported hypothetical protein [uncultured Eubacteriales bacterium]|uniref:Uncharacterized protein n=1 Tax=uncultured Eubacteriales bacterium TaxID=172733 RepID=A0A212JRK4_9FIRM|nr:exported hypothetical protein [uncultured Eubacteriales bacterium]